ncbi:hypothetical protein [Pedobacter sp. UBA5917]|jgi:hypothetical protein|uniref:hypothetical protein n=1 Tax=Pedobacter sp. UBA5917 TaxID=1947061 RepID=UPI0025D11182|nr:hypothetical protein [Pedobacter sp. UBA5917]
MNTDPLKIEVTYQQPFEVKIEFPLLVLAEYRGIDNLDEIWDDHILYWINQTLKNTGAHTKTSSLDILPNMFDPKAVFSLQMTLIAQSDELNLGFVVEVLKNEGLDKGMAIWKKNKFTQAFELLYADQHAIV